MVAPGSSGHTLCLDILPYKRVLIPVFQGNQKPVKSMHDGSDISTFHGCCYDSIFGFLIAVPQKSSVWAALWQVTWKVIENDAVSTGLI